MSKGELKKSAKSLRTLEREIPKIIRSDEKIKETIDAQIHAEYHVFYVPLSKVEEAKKEIWIKDAITDEWIIDEEAVKKWFGLSDE